MRFYPYKTGSIDEWLAAPAPDGQVLIAVTGHFPFPLAKSPVAGSPFSPDR
jgi:hypothetical protein